MPRGRAGLQLISPERVRAAFAKWYSWRAHSPTHIAEIWLVSERTVRRWKKTGLPTCYGNVWITPQEWAEFERTGECPRAKPPIAESAKNQKVSVPSTSTRPRRTGFASSRSSRTGVDRELSARSAGQVAGVKWWPMRGRAR